MIIICLIRQTACFTFQWNFLRHTAALGCKVFPMFQELTMSHFNQSSVLVLPNHQHNLRMGTELVSKKSEYLYILIHLSAQENLIELCGCESFKPYFTFFCICCGWGWKLLCNVIFVKTSTDEYTTTAASSLHCTVSTNTHSANMAYI